MTEQERPRRERDKDAKQGRIFAAARDLFDAHGFDAVTTQQIATRASVAAGTVFRHAATKAELLLMVYNARLAAAIDAGLTAAADASGSTAMFRAVEPLVRAAASARDMTAYQRELLFGAGHEHYREAGLALIAAYESALAGLLDPAADPADPAADPADPAACTAARSVFAALHLAMVQPEVRARPERALAHLRLQIDQIVAGYAATPHGAGASRPTEGKP